MHSLGKYVRSSDKLMCINRANGCVCAWVKQMYNIYGILRVENEHKWVCLSGFVTCEYLYYSLVKVNGWIRGDKI